MSAPLSTPPGRGAALAALGVQTAIAASTFVVAKSALAAFRPLELAGLRMLGAALVMGAAGAWLRGGEPRVRGSLGELALLGVIGVTVNQVCFLTGLARSTPTHAALLYALTPAFVHALAIARGDERASLRRAAGIAAAFGGAAVVIAGRGGFAAGDTTRGDLLILAGVVAWAVYSAGARRPVRAFGALRFTAITLAAGAAAGLPIVAPALLRFEPAAIPAGAWAGLAFLILFTSVIAYALWTWALRGLDASQVAIFANGQPILTAILSHRLLGEPLTPMLVAGGALVLLGVALTQTGD